MSCRLRLTNAVVLLKILPVIPIRLTHLAERRAKPLFEQSTRRDFPPSHTTLEILDQTALYETLDLNSTQS